MNNKLEFFDSLALFLFATVLIEILSLPLLIVFIAVTIATPTDIYAWIGIVTTVGGMILVPLVLYPRTMCKICIDDEGITKSLFKKSKKQFLPWNGIEDYVIVTRPTGNSYIVISDKTITEKSFEDVLKNKKQIYFSYNQKAFDIIKQKVIK